MCIYIFVTTNYIYIGKSKQARWTKNTAGSEKVRQERKEIIEQSKGYNF